MNQTALSSWWWVAADKGADRNTSVQLERFWWRGSLAGFHRIQYDWESRPGRMGFVIPIGWNYMMRPMVKIIYLPNIRSSFCYMAKGITSLNKSTGICLTIPAANGLQELIKKQQLLLLLLSIQMKFVTLLNTILQPLNHPHMHYHADCIQKNTCPVSFSAEG